MNCNTCKYYEKEKINFGECHRMPPIRNDRHSNTDMPSAFTHVKVYESDWCGEYREVPLPEKVDWSKVKK